MKKKAKKARQRPIEAAGGIVMRGRVRPHFAVVQLRRQKTWVLPKGKLNPDETALAAAIREAIEETGHDVEVYEFLGSLVYKSAGRPKTVRFWRMEASRRPVAKLMRDVRAVRWLPLSQAIAQLSHEREKLFLEKVGRGLVRQTSPSRPSSPKPAADVPAKRSVTARGRKEPEAAGVRQGPIRSQLGGQRPPLLLRKLWTLLRR